MEVNKHLNNIANVLNFFSMGGKANIVILNMETCIETNRLAHFHTQTHTNAHIHSGRKVHSNKRGT